MRLRCPSCNAVHSVEAWADEDFVVQALTTVAKLPREVAPLALRYVALFRPQGPRGLSWQKAAKVLRELHELVTKETIRWEREELPVTPAIWAKALEIVLSTGLTPPLKNHNYLRHVAFEQAKRARARAEFERERRQSYPYHRPHDGSGPTPVAEAFSNPLPASPYQGEEIFGGSPYQGEEKLGAFPGQGEERQEEVEAAKERRRRAWEKLQQMSPTEKEELFRRAKMHPTAAFLPLETVVINLLMYGEGASGDRGDQASTA